MTSRWRQTRGVVYFVQVMPAGPIKIGFTSGPVHNRVRSLQQASPHELRWIGFFKGSPVDEKDAHETLKSSQCRGEWFHPTLEVLSFVLGKCPRFDETKYLDEVQSKDCLDRISLLHRPWSRNRKSLDAILEAGGMTAWEFHAWRDGRHPPAREIAERMAETADQILLSRQPSHQKETAPDEASAA